MSQPVIYYQFKDKQPLQEYPAELISLENIKTLCFIFGDLHGNWLKIIKVLTRYKILQLDKNEYISLVASYKTIFDSVDLEKLNEHITHVISLVSNTKFVLPKGLKLSIRFLGDTVGERGANDGITAFLYKFLQLKQIGCEEVLSNHSLEFIWNHLQGNFNDDMKLKNIASELSFFFHHSLYNFKYCLKNKIFVLDNINKLLKEFYYPILKLFTYDISLDNNKKQMLNIFCHGPLLSDTIIDLAIFFMVAVPDEFKKIKHLTDVLDEINIAFKKKVDQPEEFRKLIQNAFTPLSYTLQFVYKKPEDEDIKQGPNNLLYIYLNDKKLEYAVKDFLTGKPKRIIISEEKKEQLGEYYQKILDILYTQSESSIIPSSVSDAFFEIIGPKGYPDGNNFPSLHHPLDTLVWQRVDQIKEKLKHIPLDQHQFIMNLGRHFKIAIWYGHDLAKIKKSDKPLPYSFNCLDNSLGKTDPDNDPYGLLEGKEKTIVSMPYDTQLNEQCKSHFSLYRYPEDAYQWLPDNIDENFAEHCLHYAQRAEEILSTAKKNEDIFKNLCKENNFDEKSLNIFKDLEKFSSLGHEFIHYLHQYVLITSSKKIYYYENYFNSHFTGKDEDKIKIEAFYETLKKIETNDSKKLFTKDTRQKIKALLSYSMPSSNQLAQLKKEKIWPARLDAIINNRLLFKLEDKEEVDMVNDLIANNKCRSKLKDYLLHHYRKEDLKKFLAFLFTPQPAFYNELCNEINKIDHDLWREVIKQGQKLQKEKLSAEKEIFHSNLKFFNLDTNNNETTIKNPKENKEEATPDKKLH